MILICVSIVSQILLLCAFSVQQLEQFSTSLSFSHLQSSAEVSKGSVLLYSWVTPSTHSYTDILSLVRLLAFNMKDGEIEQLFI